MNHYVYRITNTAINKHYYGKRSTKRLINDDIGILYFSSSKDKEFIQDQKDNPSNYKYKVIKVFDSSAEALAYESILHTRFNVDTSSSFYNKSKQTTTKFCTTGKVTVKDKTGNILSVDKSDCRLKTGELVGIRKGIPHNNDVRSRISVSHKGKTFTDAHKKAIGLANKGRKPSALAIELFKENRKKAFTPKAIAKRSKTMRGRPFTEEHKKRLSAAQKGIPKPCKLSPESRKAKADKTAKPADIYDYYTSKLIAANIVIARWAKENNYDAPQLSKTTRYDPLLPKSRTNVAHHKGVFVIYKDKNETDSKRKRKVT